LRLNAERMLWRPVSVKHDFLIGTCTYYTGLPDGFFQTKNPNLGKCLRALDWKMLIFILWPLGTFYGHLWYFMTIWYNVCSFGPFFYVFGMIHQKNLATLVLLQATKVRTNPYVTVSHGVVQHGSTKSRVPCIQIFTYSPKLNILKWTHFFSSPQWWVLQQFVY
jgi:hypothetical protein